MLPSGCRRWKEWRNFSRRDFATTIKKTLIDDLDRIFCLLNDIQKPSKAQYMQSILIMFEAWIQSTPLTFSSLDFTQYFAYFFIGCKNLPKIPQFTRFRSEFRVQPFMTFHTIARNFWFNWKTNKPNSTTRIHNT